MVRVAKLGWRWDIGDLARVWGLTELVWSCWELIKREYPCSWCLVWRAGIILVEACLLNSEPPPRRGGENQLLLDL